MIKDGGFARWSHGTDQGPLKWTSPKSGGTLTQWDTFYQVVLDFWATSGHSNNLPPIICVTFILLVGHWQPLNISVWRHFAILRPHRFSWTPLLSEANTLLVDDDQGFKEVVLDVLGSGCTQHSPVLWDSLLEEFGCSLVGRFNSGTDLVPIKGIIVLDLIQYLEPLKLIKWINSTLYCPKNLAEDTVKHFWAIFNLHICKKATKKVFQITAITLNCWYSLNNVYL